MKNVSDEEILEAAKTSNNVALAVVKTGLTFNAYKYRAMKLGVYNPTQKQNVPIDLEEILEGKHPQYQTFKLRNRLIKSGVKKNECENAECSIIDTWNGNPIQCQLDHKDGNRFNHLLKNLRMLCPNCHSQTETFSGKKNRISEL